MHFLIGETNIFNVLIADARRHVIFLAIDNVRIIIFGERVHFLKGGRCKSIIGVHEKRVFTARSKKAVIARRGSTARIFAHMVKAKPPVKFRDITFDNRAGIIGGAIVDNNNLEVLKRLHENTFKSLADKFFRVVEGNNNRDSRSVVRSGGQFNRLAEFVNVRA